MTSSISLNSTTPNHPYFTLRIPRPLMRYTVISVNTFPWWSVGPPSKRWRSSCVLVWPRRTHVHLPSHSLSSRQQHAKTTYLPPTRTEYEVFLTPIDPVYNEPLSQAHADWKWNFDTLMIGISTMFLIWSLLWRVLLSSMNKMSR